MALGSGPVSLITSMYFSLVLTSCRATYHSQLQFLLIDTPVITTDPRSIGLKPSGNCLPVHQGLTGITLPIDQGSVIAIVPASGIQSRALIPGPSSYGRLSNLESYAISNIMDQGSVLDARVFGVVATLHHNPEVVPTN